MNRIASLLPLLLAIPGFSCTSGLRDPSVRIGYFHGGRNLMLYRTLVTGYFEREHVRVDLVTKKLYESQWESVPRAESDLEAENLFARYGKATGSELVELMLSGRVDGGTIGETGFLKAAAQGLPIVAVAELGRDLKLEVGHAVVIKSGIKIKRPADLKRLIWGTRRSSGGDTAFLHEFLLKEGVNPNEVRIIAGIADDQMNQMLKSGKIQAGYFHLMMIPYLVKTGAGYVYRKMDWVDPEMSQSLLVFTRDFVERNPTAVTRLIQGYMKRTAYEHGLSGEERTRERRNKGMEMAMVFQGMNLPQYRKIPDVRLEVLEKMQDLLIRHKVLSSRVEVSRFIESRYVRDAARAVYPGKAP